jgi:AcrR family transcriptional regulator
MVTTADADGRGDDEVPARRRLPAAERRESILRAAAEVFARAGYRAAKVSDVAERVGVTEPVIFQNFGSKAALFAAVVERASAEVRASLDELAAGSGSASGLLAHVLTGRAPGRLGHDPADHAAQHTVAGHAGAGHAGAGHAGAGHAGAEYGVLFADAAALTADPALTEPARNAARAVAGHLADLIRRAQAEGGIRADADPEAAAWLLLSVLSARRLRAAAMPDSLEPEVTALALQALGWRL